jgi:SAM-dependent methyltransferase
MDAALLATLTPLSLHEVLPVLAGQMPKDWAYLEIGFGEGASCKAVLGATAPNPSLITIIDAFNQTFGGTHTLESGKQAVRDIMEAYDQTYMIWPAPSTQALRDLNVPPEPQTFDLVLVDGDHSAAGAMADLAGVQRLVKPGGFVVFDDIDHPAHRYLRQVWEAWLGDTAGNDGFTGGATSGAHACGVAQRKAPHA